MATSIIPDVIPPPPGIYVPVPTFFKPPPTSNGTVDHTPAAHIYSSALTPPPDLETQVAHSVYLAQRGIRGLALLGSTGEAVHLTSDERKSILKAVREGLTQAGFPDYPIIAGTASNSIDEVVLQLTEAKEAGAQWGLVLAPGYFAGATRPDGIIAWFSAVADRSPLPIMIYHYPGVSNNVKLPSNVYHALAPHPNIVGCKLSHGDASVHAQIALHPYVRENPLSFSAFTGLGQHLLPVMAVGCVGAIDGSAGFFPRTLVRLWTLAAKAEGLPSCFKTHEEVRRGSIGLWERGIAGLSKDERKELRDLQYRVSAMEELVVAHGTVGIKEAIARLRLFGDIDGTRLPLMGGMPGGDAEWARWGVVIGAVEEIETRLEKEAAEKKEKPALFSPPSPREAAQEDVKEAAKGESAINDDTPEALPAATPAETPAPVSAETPAAEVAESATTESPAKEYGVPVECMPKPIAANVVDETPKDDDIPVVSEETAKEEVKVEEPQVEETTVEEPAVEAPKVEEPKAEEAIIEEPKVEEPKVEEPKVEEPKAEEAKAEEPKVEEPAVEAPKAEETKAEEPKAEDPKIEESKAEEAKVEEPAVEAPMAEEPKVEEAKAEKANAEQPVPTFAPEELKAKEPRAVDLVPTTAVVEESKVDNTALENGGEYTTTAPPSVVAVAAAPVPAMEASVSKENSGEVMGGDAVVIPKAAVAEVPVQQV